MKILRTPALLLVLLAVPQGARAGDEAVSKAPNAFAVDLYENLRAREGNLFFSPWSAHVALSMTREGARGDTAAEMDRVLHIPGGTMADGHALLVGMLRAPMVRDGYGRDAKEVPAYELAVANALWGQEGLAFEPPFLGLLRESYGAPLERIDFRQSAKARERINAWVAKRTRDRIRDIIPEGLPTPDCLLALANAIYFKASWHKPFKEGDTEPRSFFPAPGVERVVPMMKKVDTFRYAETEDLQALELDYRGGKTSMVVLLPRKKLRLADLEESLEAKGLETLLGGLEPRRVSVTLPKFEFTCSTDLTETLPKMGMKLAFSPKADFTGITKQEPLMIGAVLHKAFVAVDKAGTEAAAATVVLMLRGGRPPGEPAEFRADRPFIFLIRHRVSGLILFMGRVVDPAAS